MKYQREAVIIGNNIKNRLIEHGYTQKWLSRRSGVLQSSISQAVNGKDVLGLVSMMKIAKALGCTVEDLLEGAYGQ